MGRPSGIRWSDRRTARTFSLPPIALIVVLLAGPGATALAPHATSASATPVSPAAVATVGAHAATPLTITTLARTHSAGVTTPGLAQAESELSSTVRPSWLPALAPAPAAPLGAGAARTELQHASASLAGGAGPAGGVPLSCAFTSATGARCDATTATSHPSISSAEQWQNASAGDDYANGVPPQGYEGSMAYDAYDGYVVYFGGCDVFACPDNLTWAYNGYLWVLLPTSFAPPAVTLAAMDYDYNFETVVLQGGCNLYQCPTNWTYIYNGEFGWENITTDLTFPSPFLAGASMVFSEGNDSYSMLFGGCDYTYDDECLSLSNSTYALSDSGWVYLPETVAPAPTFAQAMAYDPNPSFNVTVLFGGCTLYACDDNSTWIYYDFGWENVTAYLSLTGAAPAGRGFEVMTFDELDDELLIYGGTNSFGAFNDTWTLTCGTIYCSWTNVTVAGQEIPALAGAAAPSDSNAFIGTMLFGGISETASDVEYWSNGTYVYEPGLQLSPDVPSTAPARSNITVSANPSGGSAAYSLYASYGYYSQWTSGSNYWYGNTTNISFEYPGTYTVYLTTWDYFDVPVSAQFTIVVTGPTTAISGATPTDVGASLTLTATAATGGNAPYNYTWSFGDGTQAYGLSVSHAWSTAGAYNVVLEVNDSQGLTYNATATVMVASVPAVTVAANRTTIDAGMSVAFTPTVTGGTSPDSYLWTFAPGATSATESPSYTFAAAGSYKVVLNVTDAAGLVATNSVTVTVNAALGGTASASSTSVTTGTADTFTASATGGTPSYTYAWVFGDGKTGTGASTTHAYSNAGTYNAKVWINDSLGASYALTVTVTVTTPSGTGSGSSTSSSGLSGTTLYVLIGVIVLIVVIALVVLMTRRRKPAQPMSAPPSGAAGTPAPPPSGTAAPWTENPPPPGAGGST